MMNVLFHNTGDRLLCNVEERSYRAASKQQQTLRLLISTDIGPTNVSFNNKRERLLALKKEVM
jgi:hypothetical protein